MCSSDLECKTPTACADAVIEHVTDFLSDLEHNASRVRSATSTALERARGRVRMNRERLATRPRNLLTREQQKLAVHAATLRGLDPVVTMARGWSITRTVDGAIVRSTNDANPGDTLITRVADGTITSTVEK